MRSRMGVLIFIFGIVTVGPPARAQTNRLQSSDYQKLRSVNQVVFSPDGKLVAYTILRLDRPGRPWGQVWVMDLATGKSNRLGGENDVS